MENEGYIRSNIRLIIFTILTTLFVLFSVLAIFFYIYIDDSSDSSDASAVEEVEAEIEEVEEVEEDSESDLHETEIIDISNVLTDEQLEYLRNEYLPKVSIYMDYNTLTHFYDEEEDTNYLFFETTTESFGKLTARFIEKPSDLKEMYIEEVTHLFKSANILFGHEIDNYEVKIQFYTKEMSDKTFLKMSSTEIEYFYLDYLEL